MVTHTAQTRKKKKQFECKHCDHNWFWKAYLAKHISMIYEALHWTSWRKKASQMVNLWQIFSCKAKHECPYYLSSSKKEALWFVALYLIGPNKVNLDTHIAQAHSLQFI